LIVVVSLRKRFESPSFTICFFYSWPLKQFVFKYGIKHNNSKTPPVSCPPHLSVYRTAELRAFSLSDLTMEETDASALGEKTISKNLVSLSFVLTGNFVFYFFLVMDLIVTFGYVATLVVH
jgi:hypothetical protein